MKRITRCLLAIAMVASPISSLAAWGDSVTLLAVADTGLYKHSAEDRDNFGKDQWIEIDPLAQHALVRWDVASLPHGAKVIAARIELSGFISDEKVRHVVQGFLVTHDWVEGHGVNIGHYPWSGLPRDGASWDTFDGFDAHPYDTWRTPGGDCDPQPVATGETRPGQKSYLDAHDGRLVLDATALVRSWVEAGRPNYGVLLTCVDSRFKFQTRECAQRSPRLIVEYAVP
ncbi:MAG: DNRLRE domain-containing protein [Capsulimonadaceae bacterium]|nr:DNRLRE domain-containing protein [Capsulimonadaceae bacterium]